MDIRPRSAPPRRLPADSLTVNTEDLERRAKSSIGDRSTPDSIEEAASFLFNRVRALISPTEDRNAGKSSKDVERENENQRSESPAGATPSYYGDHEGESNDSESLHTARDRTPVPGGGTMNIEPKQDNGYQSSDPDLDSVVRIGTVAQKSVASSIVRDPGSHFGRPHFSHASIPADIGRVGLQKRMKNRSLGLMTPSPTASGVGVVGSLAEGSSSEDEGDEEATSGGIDPETIRRKVLSRPVFEPIRATDPIVRVVYDDSSSAPASCRGSPDLFARPLYLGSPIKRNPDTPTNTIATPPPLIGIFPATDSSNSPYSLISDDSRQRAARTPTPPSQSPTPPSQSPSPPIRSTIGHTGASTPEDGVLGTATVNRGTMTDFDYDEYAEDEYGPPGVSVMPSNMGTPLGNSSRTDLEARSHEGNIQSSRSSNAFGALSSYCDSDPQVMTRPATVSLHQAYTRQGSPKEFNTTSAIRAMLRSRAGSPVVSKAQVREDGTVAPVSSQSFTRIITDLEEMLNQALELAGRAVQDSSSALNQRDASVRSLQSSTRGSLISSGFGGTDRAVTAPESIAGPGEDTRPIDQEYYAPPKMQIAQQDANMSSSTAVYSDNGDPTSRSNVSFNGERRAKSVPPKQPPLQKIDLAESEKERSWRGYLDPSDSISKPTKKSNIQKRSFNAQSTVSSDPEQRFRMEVGRDGEIILVRIHAEKPSQPAAGSSVPGEGGVVQGQAPRRYNGGWEWGLWGKRFAVSVACGVVGLIGWIIGSYAAELPKIQEHLSISSEIATLGNSMFFLGLAIPTLLFWPLPLLHGRKPYLLLSISLLLPLQLPQALSLPPYTKNPTSWNRSMEPYVACLLFFRTVSGVILGFAFMNSMATIIDVFGPDTGACCRGGVVYNNRIPLEGHDQYNAIPGGEAGVRMGIWVGVFTWLLVASPCLGYLFGKITISRTTPAWGFWTVAILAGFLLISIIIAPEVRPPWKKIRIVPVRNASRRSRTTMIAGPETVEKGEIRMVMFGSPPNWWWEEVSAGVSLTLRMLQQYGFLVVAIYFGWVFGHIVVVITLLGSLITLEYKFGPVSIGLAIFALSLGAVLSVPSQLSLFYLTNFRHRSNMSMHNSNFGHEDVGQHPYRRTFWIGAIMLPITSIALTLTVSGPPTHVMVPVFMAALLSYSGTLVLAECYLILLDNYDISDLPEPFLTPGSGSVTHGIASTGRLPGTHRPASIHPTLSGEGSFTTSHPCLSSGLAIFHGLAFLFAAMAVGVSTHIVDGIGVRKGLGVYSGVTCAVTLALGLVLWRSKEVPLVEVFNDDEQERNAKVSLLQRSWGTRWTEVNGMEWWEDENAV